MEKEKAVIYCRVSTENQATEGISLEAQEQKARSYCELQDLEVAEVIEDRGVSGGDPLVERKGGKKLLKKIEQYGAENVVALKLDRLFRDTVDALQVTKKWDQQGIALHLVDMGGQAINTGSAMGRFFLNMMAGFAELERNLTAERTAEALQHKKENGEAYSGTPYGFNRKGNKLVVNEQEIKTVTLIKELREKGETLQGIAEELNSRGVETKQSKKWYASTVSNILKNDIYEKREVA